MKSEIYSHACSMLNLEYDTLIKNINIEYCNISNVDLREKIWIYNNYYYFIENETCINFIEKSQKILKNEDLVISVILLKSFLDKQYFKKMGYVKSDDIFNYVCDQYFKYLLINKKYMSTKKMNVNILYIIDLHVNAGIISQKIINSTGNSYKTYKYYKLAEVDCNKPLINYFNYSYKEFELIEFNSEYYITTFHYSKTFEVNKKNFNSNKSFKIKNLNYMMKKINTKLYVDDEFIKDLKNKITDTEEYLIKSIDQKQELLELFFNNELWSVNAKNELSAAQKELSELIDKLILVHFLNFNFKDEFIVFSLYTDFRGRKYYYSKIGPTDSKILRLCYYYGYYDLEDFKETNNIYSVQHYKTLNDMCIKFNWENDKRFYESFFWCIIGIGKICNDHSKSSLKTIDFIEYALYYLNNKPLLKIEDEIEISNYLRIINSLRLNNCKIKKRSIIKDATASINQIFMKKLGPINQSSLDYVNLGGSDNWFDTYLIYKEKFYEKILNDSKFKKYHDIKKFDEIFARDLIKKIIMIIPYSAGEKKCMKEYFSIIGEKRKNITIDDDLKNILKGFYDFIKHKMQEEHLYKKSTQSLVNKINEEFENLRKFVLKSETGESDISYLKMKKSSVDKKYVLDGVNKRITKLMLIPSNALDIDSFNRSSGANTAHFTDADEIREIEITLDYCIITIHDSYLIDFNSCSKLINIKIEHYQKHINKFGDFEIKNIYILL